MPRITALLGPTNTGKTHLAVERMLEHDTGVIGFPLRLLARENYDKIRALKGKDQVALVTGEEKIVPPSARWFVCTVESMPLERAFDFLAVDEIQLCADRERGHVFTDRLLHARGAEETMFLGADPIRRLLATLVPAAELQTRPRFSVLTHTGPKKLVQLPPRTAIVAFSVAEVYATAELLRRHKGGTAVVLGALSPRTRNAQVRMYQDGQVDYLVATDAIGMGLNLDVEHVAFASLAKFDGEDTRELTAAELAQIAGRAGRFLRDGTFGTTAAARALPPDVVEAIERHAFAPLHALAWRSSALDFATVADLITSLEAPPWHDALVHGRVADDLVALRTLAALDEVRARTGTPDDVRLLWDVCQVPDFRKLAAEEHARVLLELWRHLSSARGRLPAGFVTARLAALTRTDGSVEDLTARLAHVRTWSYVAFRRGWLDDAAEAQARARDAEDRLSDALHALLTQRFVDRLSSALHRRARTGGALPAELDEDGGVRVAGLALGTLRGLRFEAREASRADVKLFDKAAAQALKGRVQGRVDELVDCGDDAFALTPDGAVAWRGEPIARLRAGADVLRPDVTAAATALLDARELARVQARATRFVDAALRRALAPLYALVEALDAAGPAADGRAADPALEPPVGLHVGPAVGPAVGLTGPARGVGYQVKEGLGAIRRAPVRGLVDALAPEARKRLSALGVRTGFHHVFIPALQRVAAVDARWLLASLRADASSHAARVIAGAGAPPPPGSVSFPHGARPASLLLAAGYEAIGARAYRIDMLERAAVATKQLAKRGPFAPPAELGALLGAGPADVDAVLGWLGFARADDGRYGPRRGGARAAGREGAPRDRPDGRAARGTGLGTLGDALGKR